MIFLFSDRFELHGRDFCLMYRSRAVTAPSAPGQRSSAIETKVHSREWGMGCSRGTFTNLTTSEEEKLEVRLLYTFPCDV